MANVELSLDEEQDIQFKLSVRGSTSEMANATPLIRFLISEKNGELAVGLQARPAEEGYVTVTVPPLKSVFSENKDYVGKLEIIMGTKYFAPTSMDIKFIRTVEIEAEPVLKHHAVEVSKQVTAEVLDIRTTQPKQSITDSAKQSVEELLEMQREPEKPPTTLPKQTKKIVLTGEPEDAAKTRLKSKLKNLFR